MRRLREIHDNKWIFPAMCTLLLTAAIGSLFIGRYPVSVPEALGALFGGQKAGTDGTVYRVMSISRLPRVAAAVLTGAALSAAGRQLPGDIQKPHGVSFPAGGLGGGRAGGGHRHRLRAGQDRGAVGGTRRGTTGGGAGVRGQPGGILPKRYDTVLGIDRSGGGEPVFFPHRPAEVRRGRLRRSPRHHVLAHGEPIGNHPEGRIAHRGPRHSRDHRALPREMADEYHDIQRGKRPWLWGWTPGACGDS